MLFVRVLSCGAACLMCFLFVASWLCVGYRLSSIMSCCMLWVICWSLFELVRWSLIVVGLLLFVFDVWCLMCGVCYVLLNGFDCCCLLLFASCCLLFCLEYCDVVSWLLFIGCWFVVVCWVVDCCLSITCCSSVVVRCVCLLWFVCVRCVLCVV